VNQWGKKISSPAYCTWADRWEGLTLAINDTWAYEVKVADFELTGERTFRAKLSIVIYDHFGLDRADLEDKLINELAGFRAWYLLQHVRGFRPFVTVVPFEEIVAGSF
jgi:hypothetical protein